MAGLCCLCGRSLHKACAYLNGQPVCNSCYAREFRRGTCPSCGRSYRSHPDEPTLCRRCRPREPCIRCGKPTGHQSLSTDSGPVCSYCRRFYEEPKFCPACGQPSYHLSRCLRLGWDVPVCQRCQRRDYITCALCRKHRRAAGRDQADRPVCRRCLETPTFLCPECGQFGLRQSARQCTVCYFRQLTLHQGMRLAETLQQPWCREVFALFVQQCVEQGPLDGHLRRRLDGYIRFFVTIDQACADWQELTAERLFALFGREQLRRAQRPYAFLVEQGYVQALPREELEALTYRARQARLLARVPEGWQRQLLVRYQAFLMRRMAAYRKRGWTGKAARYLPHTVTTALESASSLLRFLPTEVTSVSGMEQHHLEHCIVVWPGRRNSLFTFVEYLNKHEPLFRKLTLAGAKAAPRHVPIEQLLSEERSRALLTEWLQPTEAGLRNALIGLLMLLYARTAKQVVNLRRGDLRISSDGRIHVKFGKAPLELDVRVCALVSRYLANLETSRGRPLQMEEYLFPGRLPGQPLSQPAIWEMLHQLGLSAAQLFSTSLVNYCRHGLAHPKVLVRLLGIALPSAMLYWQAFMPRVSEELEQRAGRR